ncbi:TBC1 domain family member 31 [Copidosoma floridanum]|uniref:TBC1 domain family member 31 n=1 Tax=Copidosoma floridanum TaxID=29053 RepID=UPI0006C94F0F|nr:TBC1 domain family member 31 [Copidosoma floridanum]
MEVVKWSELDKKPSCPNHYVFRTRSVYDGSSSCCSKPLTVNFTHCAFDPHDEALVAIDNNGMAYYIDLTDAPAYKKLGCIGLCTFLTFNPYDRGELLIGLSSTNIKVMRINSINDFCSLSGHTAPPTDISFYKEYCLTVSNKEVIVWHVKSYCRAHMLRLNVKNLVIKKAKFSSLGVVAVLYQSNVIQTWMFQQFQQDNKMDLEKLGLKNVKDFDFTKDGRAMIVCGLQNTILVFFTSNWQLMKRMDFRESFSGSRQLVVIPVPLDGGANSIIAVITSDRMLRFINLAMASVLQNCCDLQSGFKRMVVSPRGYFMVQISKHGFLEISMLDKVLNIKISSCSSSDKSKERAPVIKKSATSSVFHKAEYHLKCVRTALKEELKLPRLLPILKEFGEYPGKYRKLIWMTIMELPSNKKAYIDLSNKTPHEAMFQLLKNDPLLERCKSSLLGTTVSCLLHWCPVLKECIYIPKLVVPFLNVFQKNPVMGFEAILYILLNYCQRWFEYHPLPPLNILGIVENILLEADPQLFDYFCEKNISSTDYAWPMMQTLMTEVLSTNDWLIMWDHILSIQKPWFFLMCIIAYSILHRIIIMTKLQKANDIRQFYKTEGHVSMKTLLKLAYKFDCGTPPRIHPRRYLRYEIMTVPKDGPYLPFLQDEFPSYLTDELRGLNLKNLKDKERRLKGFYLHAMELLEEKRLCEESELFMRHVHKMRLKELRKCYENRVHDDERLLEYVRHKTDAVSPAGYLREDMHNSVMSLNGRKSGCTADYKKKKRRKSKSESCKQLQEQVERLEYEVQRLLTKLQSSSRSRYI